ncbi:MAG TPA: PBSX family phage terminase large subunit [Candidatus Blautia avistercoris]|nr:PBSX family phage terminase large subunit [Candidatus Blautia avistercoris]
MQAQKEKVAKQDTENEGSNSAKDPYDVIIPELWDVFDDRTHEHQIITSGRAGTKSSFAGILGIATIISDEPAAVVVLRKRHNKLRKTVYKEMIRAIGRLGLSKDDFDIGVSPMEIRHKRTGNVIYFSGSDSIDDTKGIIDEDKPIRLVILDELTEFFDVGEGEEELTNIEATFVRGNNESFRMLYLYNPPKNPNAPVNAWCRKMELREDVLHKHIDYRDVPVNWLGKKLLESAELLKSVDYRLYRWVWLGECIGVDDLIYYMFNDSLRKEPEAEHYKLIGVGVDYGQQNATTYQAAGLNINTRRMEGLGEFYHSGRESGKQKSPSDYAKELIKFTDALHEKYSCSVFYVFIDPSAEGLAEEIKRLVVESSQYSIVIKNAENDVAVGIQRVQKCMTYQVMSVSEGQENLIRELGTYEYDPKSIESGREKPMKVDDHCCDAWRYLVMGLWSKIKYFLPAGERGEEN